LARENGFFWSAKLIGAAQISRFHPKSRIGKKKQAKKEKKR